MPFLKLTTESELPAEGEAKEFELGGKTICVANVSGTITAMDNVCLRTQLVPKTCFHGLQSFVLVR